MARLIDIRSAVIAACSEARPSMDFPIPDKLVDFTIFSIASQLTQDYLDAKGGSARVEPWMLTRWECLAIELANPECLSGECNSYYKLDLPFTPMESILDMGIQGVYLQKNFINISWHQPDLLHLQYDSDFPPSYSRPGFTRVGQTLYFFGGDRDFTKCPILIDAAVGGILESTICNDPKITVSFPPGSRQRAIDLATQRCLAMLDRRLLDTNEDGNMG